MNKVGTNVISATDYKRKVDNIFSFVTSILTHTLGPYGSPTLIEKYGNYSLTKDGFQVLKSIQFDDGIAQNIARVIEEMSNRMVRQVGDGSTSSVVGASKFISRLKASSIARLRNRDLQKYSTVVIDKLVEELMKQSTPITSENLLEAMYSTALISTNGDEKFAQMIKEIYQGSPEYVFTISKDKGIGDTTYELIDGYKIKVKLIDNVFENSPDGYVAKNVKFIIFDHTMTMQHHEMLKEICRLAREDSNGEFVNIVVVAPAFDNNIMDIIRREANQEMEAINKGNLQWFTKVYANISIYGGSVAALFEDFAILCGSTPIRLQDFNKMVNVFENTINFDTEILRAAIGEVGVAKIDTKHTIITDFKLNEENDLKLRKTKEFVADIYNKLLAEANVNGYGSAEFIHIKNRHRALSCKVAEITVSGANVLEKELNFDAADDATKACESVVESGYNVGCNLAIIKACRELRQYETDINIIELIDIIEESFIDVALAVFGNKYGNDDGLLDPEDEEEYKLIIDKCLEDDTCYNLVTECYDKNVVNSTKTDIEILRGAISIALSMMSANQYVANSIITSLEI